MYHLFSHTNKPHTHPYADLEETPTIFPLPKARIEAKVQERLSTMPKEGSMPEDVDYDFWGELGLFSCMTVA